MTPEEQPLGNLYQGQVRKDRASDVDYESDRGRDEAEGGSEGRPREKQSDRHH